ncbi:MAG TPA: 30S ribosomal protein S6, partial [Candidatus Methylomirabilis sp.]|nr:30S ribosomal protein S6 [Candidatus Methylomirabilis sp.]
MRSYEVIFILDPALADDAVDGAIAAASGVVTKEGGEVVEVQKWGRKRLAYEVKKRREGHYIFLRLRAPVKAVSELERHLNIAEPVLKFLTVLAPAPQRKFGKAKTPATIPQEVGTDEVDADRLAVDAQDDIPGTHGTSLGTHGATSGTRR